MLFSSVRDIPELAPLVQPSSPIMADLQVDELHEYLLAHPQLLCVPVMTRSLARSGETALRLTGVVSARDFIKSMSQKYVRELSRRKTAADFMRRDFFQADASDKITDVLARLMAHDPQLATDSIVVSRRGRYMGVVAVSSLILALSDTQKHLIEQLDSLSQRLSEEVNITAELQRQLMPQQALQHEVWRVSGRSVSSSEVGGDLFDYFLLDQRWLVIAVGDASGHGVPAGMLVAAAKATLHSLPRDIVLQPSLALRQLNLAIMAAASTARLMTLFYMVVDTRQQVACYANAAHSFPLYLRAVDGVCEPISDASGLPLGLDEETAYSSCTRWLAGGDRLLFYTDGLTEQEDPTGEMFGMEPLLHALRRQQPADDLMQHLLHQVLNYAAQPSPADDLTLVVLDVALPDMRQTRPEFAYSLLKASLEQGRCQAEVQLRQRGLLLVDGADVPEQAILYPVPLMTQHFYNSQMHTLPQCQPGEHPILLAERPAHTQIANLRANGIARVLNLQHGVLHELGLEHLIRGYDAQYFLCLQSLFGEVQQWSLQHTADKEDSIARVMEAACASGFADTREELPATLALLLDEMLENAFLAVPDAERQRLQLSKGSQRPLLADERIDVRLGWNERVLGLAVTDYWGSFEPHKLLAYFERHRYGGGIVAGEGGAGLYLLWRFSDYLHIHVQPGQHTTFFVFFAAEGDIDPELDKSFQLTINH